MQNSLPSCRRWRTGGYQNRTWQTGFARASGAISRSYISWASATRLAVRDPLRTMSDLDGITREDHIGHVLFPRRDRESRALLELVPQRQADGCMLAAT